MRRLKAATIRKNGELILAVKANPGAEAAARANGIAVGKRVRYVVEREGGEHYGVVRSMHVRSVVVELSAAGMFRGGEDTIVRVDEIPFAGVLEILGDGRLAQPKVTEKSPLPMAPPRERPYATCDFDGSAIYVVERIKGRGLVAMCREHAKLPETGKGPVSKTYDPTPFRIRLGLAYEDWSNWPRPTEQELAAWALAVASKPKPSPSKGSRGSPASRKPLQRGDGRTRKRRSVASR